MKLEEFNEQERMTVKQAQKQRQLDVLACHQLLEASKPDAKVCIVYEDRRNISWSKAGDELCETLDSVVKVS